jgi:hypothetical protein
MIENRPTPSVDKPCSNCMILGMNAGLEYVDGADANTDTLMWLHHVSISWCADGEHRLTNK